MSGSKRLTPAQVRAIATLMTAGGLAEAAKAARCNERTLRRWMDEPAFVAALDQAQRQALDAAIRRLTSLSVAAGGVLARVMGDEHASNAAKIRAADIVFARMFQGRELEQFEQRLAEIEAMLRQDGRAHAQS